MMHIFLVAIRCGELCQNKQGLTRCPLHQIGPPTRSKRLPVISAAYSPSQNNSLALLASVSCSWPFQWRQCPGTTPPLDHPPAPAPPAPLGSHLALPSPPARAGRASLTHPHPRRLSTINSARARRGRSSCRRQAQRLLRKQARRYSKCDPAT